MKLGARHLLSIYASIALLTLACSGDDKPAATPSPDASATTEAQQPAPTQAPLPIEVTREPVRWVPTTVLDLASATELKQPFENFLAQSGGPPPATPPTWGVYVVEGSGEPAQVLSTSRLLTGVEWQSPRNFSVDFETVRTLKASGLMGDTGFRWRGQWRYDLGSKTGNEQLDPLPRDFALNNPPPNLTFPRPFIQLDQAHQQLLLSTGRAQAGNPASFELTDVFVVDAKGAGRRLEGLAGLRNVSWVPSGKAIVGWRGPGLAGQPFDVVFIPTTDGDALVVRNAVNFAIQSAPQSGAASSRAAFVAQGSGGLHLGIYDANTTGIRIVATVREGQGLVWPAGSERILYGEQIVDVQTGAIQPGSYIDLFPMPARDSLSPSGRLAAVLAEPQQVARDPCPGYPYQLSVTDKQTNATRTVLECPAGTSGFVQWLSESKLFGGFAACWGCESIPQRIWLFDIERGTSQSLTNGLEDWAFATPSPDKTRLLVGGTRLRLYSTEGDLLRDYGPRPEGFIFDSASWAPDGSAFAFILRQTSWPVGP